MTNNFQLLMLSPNLLRSQIPYTLGGGGVHDEQLPTFDAESKSAKIPNYLYDRGGGGFISANFQLLMLSPNLLRSQIAYMVGGGGGGVHDDQLPTFDAESKSAKIPNSLYGGWRGGFMTINFQLLMLSPNLLRSQIPYMVGARGGS